MAISFMLVTDAETIWCVTPLRINPPFTAAMGLGGVVITDKSLVLLVLAAVAMVGIHFLLPKTRMGNDLRTTSQNLIGARLIGIHIRAICDYTLIICSALAKLQVYSSANYFGSY